MLHILKNINSKKIFGNSFWEYYLDKYLLPNNKIGEYHYVKSKGSTMIIPLLNNKKYIMVLQYRYLNQKVSLEFPGGGIKQGYSALKNAKEELIEETGFIANRIEMIGEFNPFNGVTNEICSVYLASELEKTEPKPDSSEEIEIYELSKTQINKKIERGEIWDGMTLASWSLYNLKKIK